MRDVEVISQTDGFALSKRVQGFIPKSIFIKEFSADPRIEKVVLFFQEFGIPDLRNYWQSINESEIREITWATIYDLRHNLGEFLHVDNSFLDGHVETAIAWLQEHGYVMPEEGRRTETRHIPVWPPRPELVRDEPPWKSTMTSEDYEEDQRRFWILDMDAKVRKACPSCAGGSELIILDYEYVHTSGRQDVYIRCTAGEIHRKRKTIAPAYISVGDRYELVAS